MAIFHNKSVLLFEKKKKTFSRLHEERVDEYRQRLLIFLTVFIVPHSKSGLVPRSSLSGAGQSGFWEIGKGGMTG